MDVCRAEEDAVGQTEGNIEETAELPQHLQAGEMEEQQHVGAREAGADCLMGAGDLEVSMRCLMRTGTMVPAGQKKVALAV